MYQTIIQEKKDNLCILTLNRPEVYNAFNKQMATELLQALDEAIDDEEIRAVMITGSGNAFSSGQDLGDVGDLSNVDFESILDDQYNPLVRTLYSMQMPVIAYVNGVAAGAGANLALCCDILLASDTASFIQAFVNIGLVPDTAGTYYLPRGVGYQNAMALMMSGDKIDSNRAREMGMVYQVFPAESAYDIAVAFAHRLSQMPTRAIASIKNLIQNSLQNDLISQIISEKNAQIAMGQTQDFQEGVNAFKEKRKANFQGK